MSIILNQLRPLLLNINLPKFGRHLNLLRNMRELLTNYEFIINPGKIEQLTFILSTDSHELPHFVGHDFDFPEVGTRDHLFKFDQFV
jgi:hypothetical protein